MKARTLFALFAAVATGAFAQHRPVFQQGAVDLQSRTQLIANFGNIDLLAEFLGRQELSTPRPGLYGSLTLGGYYRVLPNLKVGAFYRLQAGALHSNDVIAQTTQPPDWLWNDTTGRLENLFMLDVSPRFQLGFLPGGNWVLMLKGRYLYNTFENQQSILARPELTWFWIQDRVPLLNVALSYEIYFPLNFGSTLIYQSYPYLTLLWHATPDFGIELSGAYKTTTWSSSHSWVVDAGWSSYDGIDSIPVTSWVVSLGAVITLNF